MEQQDVQVSSFYRPSLGDQERDKQVGLELGSVDQCKTVGDRDDSKLIGAPETLAAGCRDLVVGRVGGLMDVDVKLEETSVVGKRRRGRPPGRPPRGPVKTTTLLTKKKDEEDVCFVCFDGGSLVLCDRRGCPKAYHPACIKRDEAFFQSKAKWNCGWHVCNICQKASYYMCYTCPYSLCKGCTKGADYQCVRGNEGLCGACMRTVMLIENLQENKEVVHVDFDDTSSWEYLFKLYWNFLKGKLSLTSDELIRAKNPWKAVPMMAKRDHTVRAGLVEAVSSQTECDWNHENQTVLANNKRRKRVREGGPQSSEKTTGKEIYGKNNSHLICSVNNIGWNNEALVQSDLFSGVTSENGIEIDKIWNYQDPTGKVQGPFSMLQLRTWSMSGHFPLDLRIWRVNEKQDDSILLTKALTGDCLKGSQLVFNNHLTSYNAKGPSDDRDDGGDDQRNNSTSSTPVDDKRFNESRNPEQDDSSKHIASQNEPARSNEWGSHLSMCTTIINSGEGQIGVFSQGCNSLKDSNVNTNPYAPVKQDKSDQVAEGQGSERASTQSDECFTVHQNVEGQINNNHQDYGNQIDSEGHSGQSSGQNWRHPPVSSSALVSSAKSLETPEPNREVIDFMNIPCHSPKPRNGNLEDQSAENKQSLSLNTPAHDAGISWSTASSLVVGPRLHEVAGECGGRSPTPAKPPIEQWESSLVSASSLKPTEMASDCAATPASVNDQLIHSSSSLPPYASSWQALLTEPDDFSSLVDESVSDLLAEVEAMETLYGLASATPPNINYRGDLTDGSRNDCVSSVETFSPAPEPGKGDALSSTGDVHFPQQSNVASEPVRAGKADYLDLQKRSNGQSSSSGEVDGDTKHSDVSVNQWEAGEDIKPVVPTTSSWEVDTRNTPWSARPESMDPGWGAIQASANMSWAGLNQGNAIMSWSAASAPMQTNISMNSAGILGSQPRYGSETIFGPGDRFYQGRDSSFGRVRQAWNKQSFYGGGGGISPRPPPKGQRICKYYESGHCKKGASCSFWHP